MLCKICCGLIESGRVINCSAECECPDRHIQRRRDSRSAAPDGQLASFVQFTFLMTGTSHVPSIIDGGVALGQYIRSIGTNAPLGAGNQLASLSLPGDWFWKYNVNEPSALYFKSFRGLTVNLFSSFGTNHQPLPISYMVSDQKPLTGGV